MSKKQSSSNQAISQVQALVMRLVRKEISREQFQSELGAVLAGLTLDEHRELLDITGELLKETKRIAPSKGVVLPHSDTPN